ncbi:MAG: hypothetical protein VX278_13860 [Myxococcota bacterium]|nr:hypothetical protein [Myxococcota bacterium]
MFLFLISTLSWSNPSELTFALQRYRAIAGRKLLIATSGTKALELTSQCKKIDPDLDFYVHPIPTFGDVRREIKKARTAYGAKCALHLKIEKQSWKLQPFGICYDPNRKISIVEEGDTWNIIDNKNRPARAIDYAVLTQDNILMEILKSEEKQSFQLSQRLQVGAGALAATAVVPLLMMSDSDIAKNEDRIWTSLFLLGSAGIVYQSSKIPTKIKSTKSISDYFPKSLVAEKIEKTWPTPKEETDETEEAKSPEGEATESGDVSEDAAPPPDTGATAEPSNAPEEKNQATDQQTNEANEKPPTDDSTESPAEEP